MSLLPAPLRDPAFRTFFLGRAVSMLGNSMVPVALAFAVLDLTDSASALGLVLAANSIPMVLFMLVGGVVADRFSRSQVLVVSHTIAALTQGTVAALLLTGQASLPLLVALEAVNGIVRAFTFPAMQGVIPLLVPRGELQRSNALFSFARNGTFIAGPSLAAVLVVTVGSGWAIAVDAASYLLAAWAMSRLRLPATVRVETTSTLTDLRDGWSEFRSRTWVWVVVVVFGITNAIHVGVWLTLGPAIAVDTIGKGPWGAVLSAEAIGFLLMTLVLLRVRLEFPLRAGMLGCALCAPPMLLLGIAPQALPLIALSLAAGAGVEVFGIGWQTALQENIPVGLLSRVASYDALGSFVAIPIGQLSAGPLAHLWGREEVAVAGALLYAAITLGALAVPSVRRLRAGAPEPATVGGR